VEAALRRYAAACGLAPAADAAEMKLDRLLISSLWNKSEQPGQGRISNITTVIGPNATAARVSWKRIRCHVRSSLGQVLSILAPLLSASG